MEIEVSAPDVPPRLVEQIRRRVAGLERLVDDPPPEVRLTVRPGPARSGPNAQRPFVADASAPDRGRVLAAHALGPTAITAAAAAVERLRRQLRRTRDEEVALRNEPRVIARGIADLRRLERQRPEVARKPAEERRIVHRRTYSVEPEPTLSAVADLLDDDQEFRLFVHVLTREDVVVHWRDDGRVGLLHPQGSALAGEGPPVVPEPSRYSEPLPLAVARSEMDVLDHRFLYFIDEDDGRGKVLYLRYDGDYGLVEPG
ncbi:sigma 54 modulation/S30EA ribosomal C-terminal domain-containing protein [Conexibacter woesei]|uniref:sigma 54 modulation/S30EA ribosomal C-terminal domain-containing protein n=1 Tax=Conexibacter woesei TaxID=191495 RepID=UPI0003FBDEF3|nr:sigma 54 modulation/S30EA ribosomal C-terminal domain-containing protein [Conexibacter woesei]